MYGTYHGAKRCARALQTVLREAEVNVALHQCMRTMARGGGYRDWAHLRGTLSKCTYKAAELNGFLERVILSLPEQAVSPAKRWVEAQLARFNEDLAEALDYRRLAAGAGVWDFVYSIPIVHREQTPLLRPGSGSGLRIRLSILYQFCQSNVRATLDTETLVQTMYGQLNEIGFGYIDHPGFKREFERLIAAGILHWNEAEGELSLEPPPVDIVRERIACRRADDAAYWREMAAWRMEE